jgi:hypothetical protein
MIALVYLKSAADGLSALNVIRASLTGGPLFCDLVIVLS